MMNIPSQDAVSSFKRQENGDGSGSERPLKKARFAWQVKGKYHLRNEHQDQEKASEASTSESAPPGNSSDSESESNDLMASTEHNLEILGDYLLKQDFNTLDTVITDCDKSLTESGLDAVSRNVSYPRYTSSFVSSNVNMQEPSNKDLCVPMSVAHQIHEDYCITRWQDRQVNA